MIKLKNITKSYKDGGREHVVLDDVSLIIRDSSFVTIQGRSGGGKSTLLSMIALLLEPTSGSIFFDDREVIWKNEKEVEQMRRENIGLVFQAPNLIQCLSPLDNILLPAQNGRRSRDRALRLMERVGLQGKEKARIRSLSGGEAQRVSIVRALINHPKVLLCDEPTGALDQDTGMAVINLLYEIKIAEECTIIMVTHDEKIAALGEARLLLEGGKLIDIQ